VCALVLVVDDNEKNARLACDVLGLAGIRTLRAATAEEALAVARERRPDLVLMDLRLPDLDGAEAARRLAVDERTSGIPVVALSALSLDASNGWFREAGFVGYIEKPIDVRELPVQVRRYFGPD
jgi:CheY-like chemotaxis protein